MNYRRIALAGFAHAGEYLAELHILDRLIPAVVNGEIATFEGLEVLDEILRLKVPAICIGTHIGPFELVAANMAARGIPITVFAQTPRQRALKPILADIHASAGFQVIWRDDPGAAAKILRGIKDNRALCALLDQDTTLENHFVPLFGLPAAHPALPVKLGVKYGLPIVLCSAIRVSRMKYHFRYQRICYEDFLEQWDASHPEKELPSADVNQLEEHNAHDTVSREPTIEERRAQIEATAVAAQEAIGASKKRAAMRLQAAIDFVITTFATNTERDLRDHPDQWYWWHRRWRRRPGVNYDKHPDQLRSSTEYLLWLETKREQKMRGIELGND